MRLRRWLTLALPLFLLAGVFASGAGHRTSTATAYPSSDTTRASPNGSILPPPDTSQVRKAFADSALAHGSQASKDSLPKPKTRADSVVIPQHIFNHREQIITGSVIMTCLLVMLLTMNNYNPR